MLSLLVLNRVYRLEIKSVMLVFSTGIAHKRGGIQTPSDSGRDLTLYFQKGNCGASVPISTFMCLWAIYIFPEYARKTAVSCTSNGETVRPCASNRKTAVLCTTNGETVRPCASNRKTVGLCTSNEETEGPCATVTYKTVKLAPFCNFIRFKRS